MTTPSKESSWKLFDALSERYDRINSILSFGLDRGWRRKTASYLPMKRRLHLLDIASGTGAQLIACFENNGAIRSGVGIDLSNEMLQVAASRIEGKPYRDRIQFRRADAQSLPFPAYSFDAATCSFGIRNVLDPLAALKEIERVLKPGGRCLILEFSLPPKPLKGPYLFYLRRLLPRIGALLSKHKNAYRYLNETIESFPYGDRFASLLKEADFHAVRIIPMALGAVTLYLGDKR